MYESQTGQRITVVQEDTHLIGRQAWTVNFPVPDRVVDETDVIGKVARTDISQGQIIERRMVVDAPSTRPTQACPVTLPPARPFIPPEPYPPEPPGPSFWYGDESLWTALPVDGIWTGLPKNPDGYTQKLLWWREGYSVTEEPEPALQVTGHRLDDPTLSLLALPATNAYAPDIQSAMLTGVDFPTPGCWQITGRYGEAELSYVVQIETRPASVPRVTPTPPGYDATPTPVGQVTPTLMMPSPLATIPMPITTAQSEPIDLIQPLFQTDNTTVNAIYSQAEYAYLNVGPVFAVLDISDPKMPLPLGAVELPVETIADITVNNGFAYVAALEDGLRIVDISQPAQPVEVGTYQPPPVEGVGPNYTGAGPGPSNPLDYRQGARTVVIEQRGEQLYAYVAALEAGLRVVDVTNPAQPVEVALLSPDEGAIVDVAVRGERAYLVNPETGLQIVDISEPTRPQVSSLTPRGWGFAVTPGQADSPYVYVAFGSCSSIVNECAGGVHVIDASNPAAPQPILNAELPLPFSANLAISRQHLYILTAQGLSVLNISTPGQPQIETYQFGQPVADLRLVGDLLYLAAGEQGLQILDVSTPASPTVVGTWQPEASPN